MRHHQASWLLLPLWLFCLHGSTQAATQTIQVRGAVGSASSCQVSVSLAGIDAPSISVTSSDGSISFNQSSSGPVQVQLLGHFSGSPAGGSCLDPYSKQPPQFPLLSLVPPDSDTSAVSTATHYATAVLFRQLQGTPGIQTVKSPTLEAAVRNVYLLAGVDVVTPITLSSYNIMAGLKSSSAAERYQAISLMVAETQMHILASLGYALLNTLSSQYTLTKLAPFYSLLDPPATPPPSKASPAWASMTVASTAFTLASSRGIAVAPVLSAQDVLTPVGMTFASQAFVLDVLRQAVNTTLGPQALAEASTAISTTATVAALLANHLEPWKLAALQARLLVTQAAAQPSSLAVSKLAPYLNPLEVSRVCASMSALTTTAAVAVAEMLTINRSPSSLTTLFAADALGTQVLQAGADVGRLHADFGLGPLPAPAGVQALAQLVGPMTNCPVISQEKWTDARSSATSDRLGRAGLPARGIGQVGVWPQPSCKDAFSNFTLSLPVTTLSPPTAYLLLTPITLITQGLYDVQAVNGPATVPASFQSQAYTAFGLFNAKLNDISLETYIQGIWQDVSNNSSPTSAWALNPYSVAVAATSVQVYGWMALARALFTLSAFYGGSPTVSGSRATLSTLEQADAYVVRLASAAMALEVVAPRATSPGGMVSLSDAVTLQRMVAVMRPACNINSQAVTLLSPPPPPSPPRPTMTTATTASATTSTTAATYRSDPVSAATAAPAAPDSSAFSSSDDHDAQPALPIHSKRLCATEDLSTSGTHGLASGLQVEDVSMRHRTLKVFTDSSDFQSLANGLSVVLANLNGQLQAVQAQSLAASRGDASQYNITDAWLSVVKLAILTQGWFRNASIEVMGGGGMSGVDRVQRIQLMQLNTSSDALTRTLAAMDITTPTLCALLGTCYKPSASKGSSVSTTLALALGLGLGLGLPCLCLVAWLAHRCSQNQQVVQGMRQYQTDDPGFGNLFGQDSSGPSGVVLAQQYTPHVAGQYTPTLASPGKVQLLETSRSYGGAAEHHLYRQDGSPQWGGQHSRLGPGAAGPYIGGQAAGPAGWHGQPGGFQQYQPYTGSLPTSPIAIAAVQYPQPGSPAYAVGQQFPQQQLYPQPYQGISASEPCTPARNQPPHALSHLNASTASIRHDLNSSSAQGSPRHTMEYPLHPGMSHGQQPYGYAAVGAVQGYQAQDPASQFAHAASLTGHPSLSCSASPRQGRVGSTAAAGLSKSALFTSLGGSLRASGNQSLSSSPTAAHRSGHLMHGLAQRAHSSTAIEASPVQSYHNPAFYADNNLNNSSQTFHSAYNDTQGSYSPTSTAAGGMTSRSLHNTGQFNRVGSVQDLDGGWSGGGARQGPGSNLSGAGEGAGGEGMTLPPSRFSRGNTSRTQGAPSPAAW